MDLSQVGLNAQHHHRAKNQLHHPLHLPHRQEILIHHRQEGPAGIGEVSPLAKRIINFLSQLFKVSPFQNRLTFLFT